MTVKGGAKIGDKDTHCLRWLCSLRACRRRTTFFDGYGVNAEATGELFEGTVTLVTNGRGGSFGRARGTGGDAAHPRRLQRRPKPADARVTAWNNKPSLQYR